MAQHHELQPVFALLPNDQAGGSSRCRYPGKICRNSRVPKASGSLHRYCAFHRQKANLNQKRWVDRQRVTSPTASSSSSSASSSSGCSSSACSPVGSTPSGYPGRYYRWIMAATTPTTSTTSATHTEPVVAPLVTASQASITTTPATTAAKAKASEPADDTATAVEVSAATLSEDDWDGLLALLRDGGSDRHEEETAEASKPLRPTGEEERMPVYFV